MTKLVEQKSLLAMKSFVINSDLTIKQLKQNRENYFKIILAILFF